MPAGGDRVGKRVSVSVGSYLSKGADKELTASERKAWRRREEMCRKAPWEMVSDRGIGDWGERQKRLVIFGYRSKIVCPGKPDRHLLPFVDPEKVAHRANGYNIARIHGIADKAKADGCIAAALLTLTLPGRMHSGLKGFANPLWDGSTPEDGRLAFARIARNIRQRLKRLGASGVLGYVPWFYRAMESHKDGTPHQHWVIFFRPGDAEIVSAAIDAAYPGEDRAHERRRIKFEICRHFDGAQSYIRKYVTKNTKGLSPGFKRQRVWRNIWGVRCFGTSLGLRAGIYKLLRRYLAPGQGSDCPGELAAGVRLARGNEMAAASLWADGVGLKLVYEDRLSFRGDWYKAVVGMVDTNTGESWLKPRWTVEPVFREVVVEIDGRKHRYVYNSLYQQPAGEGGCGAWPRCVDGKIVVPGDVFEELDPEWMFDPEKEAYEFAEHNPDDPDRGGA